MYNECTTSSCEDVTSIRSHRQTSCRQELVYFAPHAFELSSRSCRVLLARCERKRSLRKTGSITAGFGRPSSLRMHARKRKIDLRNHLFPEVKNPIRTCNKIATKIDGSCKLPEKKLTASGEKYTITYSVVKFLFIFIYKIF